MSTITASPNDTEMIQKTVQVYVDGAKSGRGEDMIPVKGGRKSRRVAVE